MDTSGRGRRSFAVVACVAAALSLVAAGCTASEPVAPQQTATSSPETAAVEPAVMPDAVGQDLEAVGSGLEAAGVSVEVFLPRRVITRDPGGGDYVADATPTVLSAETTSFDRRGGWTHAVEAQDPKPGTPLEPGMAVRLTAGRHEGGYAERPWAWEHAAVMDEAGPGDCLGCHQQTECTACHVRLF